MWYCGIKSKDCEWCLEYSYVKDDLILYKCFCCNKNYQKNWSKVKEAIYQLEVF